MKKLDSRYIDTGVFLLLFVLRGILNLFGRNHSFTLDKFILELIIVSVVIGLDWYQFIRLGVHLNLFSSF